jgi:Family of unknown function (DUF6788)
MPARNSVPEGISVPERGNRISQRRRKGLRRKSDSVPALYMLGTGTESRETRKKAGPRTVECLNKMASMSAETKSGDSLPKTLPGVVCEQWKRCGRKNCRCAGGAMHGPYFYRFWRQAGRLRKAYVPRDAVADVRCQCKARQEEKRILSAARKEWREMMHFLREAERHE